MTPDIPPIGLGTDQNTALEDDFEVDFEACVETVTNAIEIGYRHIDTAQIYGTEPCVGAAIERSTVPRDDLFVATKVHYQRAEYEDALESVEQSLEDLGLEQIDLLYVHWPAGTYDPEGTLRAFNELHDRGVVANVGVSNFTPALLDEARDLLEPPIVAHQVELHPLLQQTELREYAERHDHRMVAYSPLIRGRVGDVPELASVAAKHDVSPAQVSLAWMAQKDVVPVPKASSETHRRENAEAIRLELDDEDIDTIDSIDQEQRIIDFEFAPWNDERN
ncbi:aldo/keto reductase [Natrarchaeobius halalkaliphilus]|uniref:Aldo/keto reductase n=1 Tax=Natrarchaeobius halalkaliphilus TaxID=1679091 RepID=A0A3N6LS47_9EURY|nr:aldo/keto reductase [Natrarchaeobius halalkaliphilus]RQG90064.1 aldo/keto reductase [Natrarchaeobius halalkaliphilus]